MVGKKEMKRGRGKGIERKGRKVETARERRKKEEKEEKRRRRKMK
jgi:hypothetical protein